MGQDSEQIVYTGDRDVDRDGRCVVADTVVAAAS